MLQRSYRETDECCDDECLDLSLQRLIAAAAVGESLEPVMQAIVQELGSRASCMHINRCTTHHVIRDHFT